MKKRIGLLSLAWILILGTLTGCLAYDPEVVYRDGKSAYELAVENGFKGSMEEWLDSLNGDAGDAGADGNGIERIEYIDGDLIITYTDGRRENLGTLTNERENTDFSFARLADGTYAVLSCDLTDRTTVTVPAVQYGRAVTEIFDYAFQNDTAIEEVILPSTVTTIGNYAFAGCTSLKSITIPSSVTRIDEGAFSGCTALKSITFENAEQWRASGVMFAEETLADPTRAAEMMTGSYVNSAWRQMTSEDLHSIVGVVDKVADAVVVINATVSTGFFGSSTAAGSGVIVSEEGYVLTCNHVVEGARSIEVKLNSGTTYQAELVGSDAMSDIAVLKIVPRETLTSVKLGSSAALVVGEPVVAIGNPLGTLDGTVTSGIISATERTITMSDGTSMTLLQTDAAINSGNSGGGLFNIRGELIGIVNAKYASSGVEGLAFAIPIDWANEVHKDLIEYGYVRGIVDSGLVTLDVTVSNYAYYNANYGIGELGVYVVESSIATEIQNKDRIVSVNGVAVNTTAELKAEIKKHKIGDTLTIVASRNRSKFTVSLTLQEYVPDGIQ